MRTIKECIKDLKERRDWKNPEEVDSVFDEILEIDKTRTDKVVEQITDLTAETFKIVDNSAYVPASKVIDIVKRGGVE